MKGAEQVKELADLESSLEELVDGLVKDIGRKSGDARRKGGKRSVYGTRQMQATYLEICRTNLNPVARYLKAMHLGVVTKDMIEVMELMTAPLVKKTRQVGLEEQARKLRSFHVVLQEISKSDSARITAAQQQALDEVYWPVHESFGLEMRGNAIAVANLLTFYRKLKRSNQVNSVELRKVFAIGVPCLTMIRKSSLEELTSLTGIEQERMRVIRKIAREFQLVWFME